ncbi:hypothetical protein AC625_03620 [Peribacillus loiseleuriae]|uniref:Uncharacterized protein n=1 Tax=Peribacillus loiseleuriae TaxID=1679170 RepID=A0A0K9GPT8_9BACI|nr:hypothetical protein AC625_03620 [Peribacillus loiseleuriae]
MCCKQIYFSVMGFVLICIVFKYYTIYEKMGKALQFAKRIWKMDSIVRKKIALKRREEHVC